MRHDRRATAAIKGHPVHYLLVPIPIVSFILAFAADVAFVVDGSNMWAQSSTLLIITGLAGAAVAAIAGFADFLGNARIREFRDAWLHMFANVTVVLIEALNLILRVADQRIAGSIGIVLSGAAVLLLVFSGWMGGNLVYRHGVGQFRD
jgi:uncharacterized membrane protein